MASLILSWIHRNKLIQVDFVPWLLFKAWSEKKWIAALSPLKPLAQVLHRGTERRLDL
jgi:hypothetical protein